MFRLLNVPDGVKVVLVANEEIKTKNHKLNGDLDAVNKKINQLIKEKSSISNNIKENSKLIKNDHQENPEYVFNKIIEQFNKDPKWKCVYFNSDDYDTNDDEMMDLVTKFNKQILGTIYQVKMETIKSPDVQIQFKTKDKKTLSSIKLLTKLEDLEKFFGVTAPQLYLIRSRIQWVDLLSSASSDGPTSKEILGKDSGVYTVPLVDESWGSLIKFSLIRD